MMGLMSYEMFLLSLIFSEIKSCLAALSDFFYRLGLMLFFSMNSMNCEGISAKVSRAKVTSPFYLLNLSNRIKSTTSLSQT
jgi:hypothetical protein